MSVNAGFEVIIGECMKWMVAVNDDHCHDCCGIYMMTWILKIVMELAS